MLIHEAPRYYIKIVLDRKHSFKKNQMFVSLLAQLVGLCQENLEAILTEFVKCFKCGCFVFHALHSRLERRFSRKYLI